MQEMYGELGDGTGSAEEVQGVWECVVEREASEGGWWWEAEGEWEGGTGLGCKGRGTGEG